METRRIRVKNAHASGQRSKFRKRGQRKKKRNFKTFVKPYDFHRVNSEAAAR